MQISKFKKEISKLTKSNDSDI